MGRPAKFDREKALDAATKQFLRNGYEGTSISDLANSMSITRSSFYNSFNSRQKVFQEVLNRYKKHAPDHILGDVKTGDAVLPVLHKLFDDICLVRSGDDGAQGCLVANCLGEFSETGSQPPYIKDLFEAKIARFETLLRQAKNQMEIDQNLDEQEIANAIVTFLTGLNMISKIIRDEKKLKKMCATFLESHGLSPR